VFFFKIKYIFDNTPVSAEDFYCVTQINKGADWYSVFCKADFVWKITERDQIRNKQEPA